MLLNETQKVGVFFTGFGLAFLFLGGLLFFDRGFLSIGNILFLIGLTLVIGVRKTYHFFFQVRKLRGSTLFFAGILLVLWGRTFFGIFLQSFGFINLFGDFFPVALAFARRIPVIGTILNLPGVRQLVDGIVYSRSRV